MSQYWDIEEGRVDSAIFFTLLPKIFDDATTVFIEGTSIDKQVKLFYTKHSEPGIYAPGKQTLWPKSKLFRCRFTQEFIEELVTISRNHAEPELMDHFFLYKGDQPLLEWHDAFANAMLLSKSIPESRVAEFSSILGLPYGIADLS